MGEQRLRAQGLAWLEEVYGAAKGGFDKALIRSLLLEVKWEGEEREKRREGGREEGRGEEKSHAVKPDRRRTTTLFMPPFLPLPLPPVLSLPPSLSPSLGA